MKVKIKMIKKDYHRNGVAGNGFDVVLFKTTGDPETRGRTMVGVVFPEPGSTAVFDVTELAKGNIEFANGNSWRGDCFEHDLRALVKES